MTERRESILTEAEAIVHGDRQRDYGHPRDNFKLIADLCRPIIDRGGVTPATMCMCLIQIKLSRELNRPKRDNRTDIAGYAELLDRVSDPWTDDPPVPRSAEPVPMFNSERDDAEEETDDEAQTLDDFAEALKL